MYLNQVAALPADKHSARHGVICITCHHPVQAWLLQLAVASVGVINFEHCGNADTTAPHVQTAEKGKAVASSDSFHAVESSEPVTDWQDYSNYYDEYDDDEEVTQPSSSWLKKPHCVLPCLDSFCKTQSQLVHLFPIYHRMT